HQRANYDEYMREGNDRDLSVAIAAMCDDFGQHASRQRTLSWVSSSVSSAAHVGTEEPSACHSVDAMEDYVIVDSTPDDANRKQQVRLTTINPVTANIMEQAYDSNSGKRSVQELLPDNFNQEYVSKDSCSADLSKGASIVDPGKFAI
ncbi:hypothetical protein IW138_005806, partial [Coemansia sp. RSA 986]